ncbi:hypothetical protein H1R20_g15943, partial [Candolleomyces eurysporus]
MQMQRLVYGPFKSAAGRGPIRSLAGHPFLVVIDGLDECEDKDEVEDLIDSFLVFFNENPFIPLRVLITSRVEQHIRSRLNVPGVRLDNLVDHCSDDDITAFLDVLFQDARRRNPVIQAYVQERGEWPTPIEKRKLVEHIGGSFIFASAVFKYIMGSSATNNHSTTPMDRLPLALNMNPGLDGLYAQTLARSKHLPHFLNIISTIALLEAPLPTSGIAELLGIHTYEVVHVLVNLQAIIQVPGTDDTPVTLCHTSLRDFLTTQSRSGRFFAHPHHHVRLFLRTTECELGFRKRRREVLIEPSQCTPAVAYSLTCSLKHLARGTGLFQQSESDSAIRSYRDALALYPGTPGLVFALAHVICSRAMHTGSFVDLEEAISLHRHALVLGPSSHYLGRAGSLNGLGSSLMQCYWRTGTMANLEEAICVHREALALWPFPHPHRPDSLNTLGTALLSRHRRIGSAFDLEEAISLHREALELRPLSHPDRCLPLSKLGNTLLTRYRHTGVVKDLDESISLFQIVVELRPSPHPGRSSSLGNLGGSLRYRYRHTGIMADLENAISLYREALDVQPSSDPQPWALLNDLGNALMDRYRCTGSMADLGEVISLYRQALKLKVWSASHPERYLSLNNLGVPLLSRYWHSRIMADLEEAISLYREALQLRPPSHLERWLPPNNLGVALLDRYRRTGVMADLKEAISLFYEALELRPSPHPDRSVSLNNLGSALLARYRRTRIMADLEKAISLCRQALQLRPSPHRHRSFPLNNISLCLETMYKDTHALPHLQEAIAHCEELIDFHYPIGHQHRVTMLNRLASLLQKLLDATGRQEDRARIEMLKEEASSLSASTSATIAASPGIGVTKEGS